MQLITASTTNLDTTTIIDNYGLAKGGDDEYIGRQIICVTPTGSIVAGEKSWVSDFDKATFDASLAPAFTSTVIVGDVFEMWKVFTYEEINDAINQTISEITGKALQIKETHAYSTEEEKYLYDVLSGFTHLSKVEYASSTGIYYEMSRCEGLWSNGSANVTVTNSSFNKEGDYSIKAVEDGGSGAGAVLVTGSKVPTDFSDADKVEFWMYSSIALTAGQLQFHFDDSTLIASGIDKIDIPAMDAATWYRHSLSLANPHLDTAIISYGIYQVSDVGAFTFYLDDVSVIDSRSRIYKELPIEYWGISQGATPYLMITKSGLDLTGSATDLRLTGFQIPTLMTADTDTSEIDPAYLIAKTTGRLLISHAKSSFLDIDDRAKLASYWLGEAARMETGITTSIPGTTRVIKA